MTIEVKLFGHASVSRAGVPIKFSKRSLTFSLLTLLILRRGQPLTRTFLAFTLFPDFDEALALKELRRYLYLAAKAMPIRDESDPWFIADAESVRWNVAAGADVDVTRFEDLAQSESTYAQAVKLYTGDLLEELYDDWIVAERERFRSRYVQLVEWLIEKHRAARDHASALAYANRLLATDSFREDIVRQIMAIRYASGDAAGALAGFDRFAKELREELGVTPMAETVSVRETILRGLPLIGSVDRVSPASGDAPARSIHFLPFCGREDEISLLQSRLDRAARGFGSCVFIGGEAGVGKTRLVGEVARLVERQGGRVYSGGTSSPESSPYQSIVEALRAALPVLAGMPANANHLGVLARVFPELGDTALGLPAVPALAPDRESARLLGAFASACESLAFSRPLLIVLEDLHWASQSTVDALATICRRIDRSRVLILVTYREEDTPADHPLRRLSTSLGVEGRMTGLHLRRFSRPDVEQTVASTPGLSAAPEFVDRLYALSEGNALFLTETIANLLQGGIVYETTGDLPARGIERIVADRSGTLSDAARTVAEIAAACGDGCDVDMVADVTGFSAAETLDAFNELLDRRLVREAGARARFDYVFTHNLIRTSMYEQMDRTVRNRRHARIAHVIERRGRSADGNVRELARHYEAAGLSGTSARWYCRAAREAAALHAHDDAAALASRAIELSDDELVEIEARFLREEANARLANREDQAADLERLDSLAQDSDLKYRVRLRIVELRRRSDDREAEFAAIAELRDMTDASGNQLWQAAAAIAEAKYYLAVGRYIEAKTLGLATLSRLDHEAAPGEYVEALSTVIEADVSLGEFPQAERRISELSAIAVKAEHSDVMSEVLQRRISSAMLQQQFDRAAESARELLSHYRLIGDRIGEARALSNIATASVRLGRWQEARQSNVTAAGICETIGDRWGVARAQMNLGMLLGRCGDLESARSLLASAREHHLRLGDRRAVTASLVNEGFIALWQGQAQDAKRLSTEALTYAREMDHAPYIATSLANLGAAERDLGELDSAIEHMNEGLGIQVNLNRMSDGVSDLADLALAYALRDDMPAARDLAERVLHIDRSWTDAAIFPPYPLWIVACILHWTADERANEVLEWSWQVAVSFAASIEDELRGGFEALPFFGAIRSARSVGSWPGNPRAVRLAHAGAVHSGHGTGKPAARGAGVRRSDVGRTNSR